MARRWVRRLGLLLIGTPVVATAALGGYIQYRKASKPPEHVFQPLVSADGSLMLQDCKYPPPSTLAICLRFLNLLRIFLPAAILYFFMKWRRKDFMRWLNILLASVERAGPAFVKAGQWACTRSDLFSAEFREVFTQLYSEVHQHPFESTVAIIESDMKKSVHDIFKYLDPMPIGSGSIGQVHAGVTKDGRKVVVKVMHPHVVETIAKDFFVINGLARFADKYIKNIEHLELQTQALAWTNHLAAQLDFRIEAAHLALFRENFADCDYVTFPEPIDSTQHCLIMTYAEGEPATEEFLKTHNPQIRDILAAKGLNCFCKMMLRDNFIHGDLHPGNILIDTKTDPLRPHVTLIDVGLCQKLTALEGERCGNLLSSFVHWKAPMAYQALLDMGSSQKYCNKSKLLVDLEEMFQHYRPTTGEEEGVVSNILQAVFETMRVNRLSMEPTYVGIVWAVLVLEGFIMALNPEFNMVVHSAPWLVGDGHLSLSLAKKLAKSGYARFWHELNVAKQRLFGHDQAEEFVPTRRKRFAKEHFTPSSGMATQ